MFNKIVLDIVIGTYKRDIHHIWRKFCRSESCSYDWYRVRAHVKKKTKRQPVYWDDRKASNEANGCSIWWLSHGYTNGAPEDHILLPNMNKWLEGKNANNDEMKVAVGRCSWRLFGNRTLTFPQIPCIIFVRLWSNSNTISFKFKVDHW